MQTAIGKLVTRNTTLTTINIMVDDVTRLLRPLMAEVLHGEFYRINTQRSTTTLSLCGTFADDETLSAARSTATRTFPLITGHSSSLHSLARVRLMAEVLDVWVDADEDSEGVLEQRKLLRGR